MPTKRNLEAKDPQILLNKISSEFPELKWKNYRFLNHGWDHEVIILDNKWVFRFPNSSEYLKIFNDEPRILQLISSRCKTKIPAYTFLAKDGSFGGYELISGKELDDEQFLRLSVEKQTSLAIQLSEFLSALHTIRPTELRPFHVATVDYKDDLAKLKRQVKQYLPNTLSREDYIIVQDILVKVDSIITKQPEPVLIHHDISSAHILWDDREGKIGIIDFSDRSIGDPASDFAELYSYGKDFVDQVYEHYAGTKDASLLKRAMIYYKRVGVFLLVDSFISDKITFEKAKGIFDKTNSINF